MIAPLDWGLGHITRCIPLIQLLIDNGHHIITCGNRDAEYIFRQHFKNIEHHIIEGYNVKYGLRKSQALSMILQSPKFFRAIFRERKIAEGLAKTLNLDYIISDNRYGFRSSKTKNIFITHQIHIQGPKLLLPIFYKISTSFINKFEHCWIPDYPDIKNLSGILSQNPKPDNCSFIGPLSRFKNPVNSTTYKFKYLAILSGPEPQRTLFENIVLKQFMQNDSQCAVLGGIPLGKNYINKNVHYFCHLNTKDFIDLVSNSEYLICRAGYSNIMDLSVLEKNALLVPTPGQTEQEYLAKYHSSISDIKWVKQNKFTLNGRNDFGKITSLTQEDLLLKELTQIGL